MSKKVLIIRIAVIFVAVIITVLTSLYFFLLRPGMEKINSGGAAGTVKPEEDAKFNVLLVGSDKKAGLADTIMLLNVDTKAKTFNLISIPRDTRIKLKHFAKINSAYNSGGLELLTNVVKEVSGAPVNYYITVDLSGFKNMIEALGGVDFDVPQDMKYNDPAQDLHIDLKKGMQHLDGDKAEQLVRFRRYIEGDIQRTRVQQAFIKAVFEQKFTLDNIAKLPTFFQQASDYCRTNFTIGDILKYSGVLKSAIGGTFTTHELPGYGQNISHISYYIPKYDEAYPLFQQYFMGAGAPAEKKYTDMTGTPSPDAPSQSSGGSSTKKPPANSSDEKKPSDKTETEKQEPPVTTTPETPVTEPPATTTPETPTQPVTPPTDTQTPPPAQTPPADTQTPPVTEPPATTVPDTTQQPTDGSSNPSLPTEEIPVTQPPASAAA